MEFWPLLFSVSFTQIIIPIWRLYIKRRAKLSEEMFLFLIVVSLRSIWRKPRRNPLLLDGYNRKRFKVEYIWTARWPYTKNCLCVGVCVWWGVWVYLCIIEYYLLDYIFIFLLRMYYIDMPFQKYQCVIWITMMMLIMLIIIIKANIWFLNDAKPLC